MSETNEKLSEAISENAEPLNAVPETEAAEEAGTSSESYSNAESAENESEEEEDQPVNNWLTRFYDRFEGVPLKFIDTFIVVCVIALICVVTVGILKAKHMI